jgi:hypothetical protein
MILKEDKRPLSHLSHNILVRIKIILPCKPRGDSDIKGAGMLVRNFENNP